MFRMIRVAHDYELVIVVTPEAAGPETAEAKFYRFATWTISGHKPNIFNEITREEAIGYFSGHADGLGFAEPPEVPFANLNVALAFIRRERNKAIHKLLRAIKKGE